MVIVRNDKRRFNVVDNPNKLVQKVYLGNVTLEQARAYIAKNGADTQFSKDYRKNVFSSGKYDIFGKLVTPERTKTVNDSILSTWEELR